MAELEIMFANVLMIGLTILFGVIKICPACKIDIFFQRKDIFEIKFSVSIPIII